MRVWHRSGVAARKNLSDPILHALLQNLRRARPIHFPGPTEGVSLRRRREFSYGGYGGITSHLPDLRYAYPGLI